MTNVVPLTRQRLSRNPWAIVSIQSDGIRTGNWRYSRRSFREAINQLQQLESQHPDAFELWYDPRRTIVCFNDLLLGEVR